MNYPIVIHKDPKTDYGVTVPDLPGCFSAGSTLDEALAMAREAIELHVEGLIAEGQAVPDPSPIEVHQKNPDLAGGVFALVSVDLSNLPQKALRINISMPARVLAAIDRFADGRGETRSGLLAKAATEYIAARKAGAGAGGVATSGGSGKFTAPRSSNRRTTERKSK